MRNSFFERAEITRDGVGERRRSRGRGYIRRHSHVLQACGPFVAHATTTKRRPEEKERPSVAFEAG